MSVVLTESGSREERGALATALRVGVSMGYGSLGATVARVVE